MTKERKQETALADNPLVDDEILVKTFFRPQTNVDKAEPKAKPEHYKICCISLYNEDIARLDALVAELKRRGHTKANKSMVIRYALAHIDLDGIPKGY